MAIQHGETFKSGPYKGLTPKEVVFRNYANSLVAGTEMEVDELWILVKDRDIKRGTVDKWRRSARKWLLDQVPRGLNPYYTDNRGMRVPKRSEEYAHEMRKKLRTNGKRKEDRGTKRPSATQLRLSDEDGDSVYAPQEGDQREVVAQQIRARRGGRQFRDELRKRYGDRCLVTGCEVLAVLEAAHIKPYRGENDNNPTNGLLLRADIHTLFDLNLIGIEPEQRRVELASDLRNDKVYGKLAGTRLDCEERSLPSQIALQLRYEQFRKQNK
jgi:putative restriction endonuclease